MKFIGVLALGLFVFSSQCFALPIGDSQGKVRAVRVVDDNFDGSHRFQIWFSQNPADIDNDRWGCIANPGYVIVNTAQPLISPTTIKMLLSIALTAQATGKKLALDSYDTDSCNNGAHMWIVD